jgi:hypothetical protein
VYIKLDVTSVTETSSIYSEDASGVKTYCADPVVLDGFIPCELLADNIVVEKECSDN